MCATLVLPITHKSTAHENTPSLSGSKIDTDGDGDSDGEMERYQS